MFCDVNLETPLLLSLCFLVGVVVHTDAQHSELVEGPVDTTGVVGGSVSFDCDVTTAVGYSILWKKMSPTFMWISRDGTVFREVMEVDSTKFSVQTDEEEPGNTLHISNLQPSDAGVYECSYDSSGIIGSAELTVIMNDVLPVCQYVQVPNDSGIVVDLSCSWSPSMSNSPAKLYHGAELLQPDFNLNDRIVSRQSLQQIDQTSEFECRWESSSTGRTTTCSFPQSAVAEIRLGVDPYVNSVVENQTARFTCDTAFDPPTTGEDISYSWSLIKNGVLVDLSGRQKGFMRQTMRILAVELMDKGLVVECTARKTNGAVTLGFGSLNVYTSPMTTTMTPKITTTLQTEASNKSSLAPRGGTLSLSITITIVLIVLVVVILVLVLLVIFMARSKLKRSHTIRFRRKTDGRLEEADFHRGQEVLYPDPNPDIIQAHSSSLPLYAMPDKLMKANTVDGRARYPPKHYLPRRRSYGEDVLTETELTQHSSNQMNENYPNPYEDIDCEAIEEAKRSRSKSHTVSRFNRMTSDGDAAKTPFTAAAPQRKYRGMKSASSTSALYDKPEKPPRNQPRDVSPLNRKSWDLPGSIENLCNSVSADKRSLKSFTASICEQDGYACVEDDYDEIEGDTTMVSDYMDMNPILDKTDMTMMSDVDMTQENILSTADDADMPVYAQIKR